MRHRRKEWQTEILEKDFEYYIREPQKMKGQWNTQNWHHVHLEIGSGKGQYLIEMAKLFPNTLFIGIEVMPLIGSYILKKMQDQPLPNVRIIIDHAQDLTEWFDKDEIDVIHLNFSDPWPKRAHAKRRLTYPTFLSMYKKILKDDGMIIQKTDNAGFFEYSVVTLNQNGYECNEISLDFRRDEQKLDAFTEYEERFMALGQPIYRACWTISHD